MSKVVSLDSVMSEVSSGVRVSERYVLALAVQRSCSVGEARLLTGALADSCRLASSGRSGCDSAGLSVSTGSAAVSGGFSEAERESREGALQIARRFPGSPCMVLLARMLELELGAPAVSVDATGPALVGGGL